MALTLEEAIKAIETIAEERQRVADTGIVFNDVTIGMLFCDDTEVIEEHLANYRRDAEDYRQIAEWLKDYKQLLEKSRQKARDKGIIYKLIQWFKRDACKECDYYHPQNNVCQSKKCATCWRHPYVNWFDRHFCEPYKVGRQSNGAASD